MSAHRCVYEQADLYCAAFAGPVDDEVDWLLRVTPNVACVVEPFCGQARFAEAFTPSRARRGRGTPRAACV